MSNIDQNVVIAAYDEYMRLFNENKENVDFILNSMSDLGDKLGRTHDAGLSFVWFITNKFDFPTYLEDITKDMTIDNGTEVGQYLFGRDYYTAMTNVLIIKAAVYFADKKIQYNDYYKLKNIKCEGFVKVHTGNEILAIDAKIMSSDAPTLLFELPQFKEVYKNSNFDITKGQIQVTVIPVTAAGRGTARVAHDFEELAKIIRIRGN